MSINSIFSDKVKFVLFFGGPSNEKNISLDSCRTFYDSLRAVYNESNIDIYFISQECEFYLLSKNQIYSNTIHDFEEDLVKKLPSHLELIAKSYDVYCPLIHGEFGEDGQLTSLLEGYGIRSILGSDSSALKLTIDKDKTLSELDSLGYITSKRIKFNSKDYSQNKLEITENILERIPLDVNGKFIIKPNDCGSSDGVSLIGIDSLSNGVDCAKKYSDDILVEQKIVGKEFSIIVIKDHFNNVIPLLPTSVNVLTSNFSDESGIYSRYKKYMPGTGAVHVTPMNLNYNLLNEIRSQSRILFNALKLDDWVRMDGFLLDDNKVIWSDINGIPGFGQDSFFFQQCALLGLNSIEATQLLVDRVIGKSEVTIEYKQKRERSNYICVGVVGGGNSSEKNVSRMSWSNVIQKLSFLNNYRIINIFQDSSDQLWVVPLFIVLQHTIEEIEEILFNPNYYSQSIKLAARIIFEERLNFNAINRNFSPYKISLKLLKEKIDFLFIALHGGSGENGDLQEQLDMLNIRYNGNGPNLCQLFMNKHTTNQQVKRFKLNGISTTNQRLIEVKTLKERVQRKIGKIVLEDLMQLVISRRPKKVILEHKMFKDYQNEINIITNDLMIELKSENGLVMKPLGDGCSSGIIVARSPSEQIPIYLLSVWAELKTIPLIYLYDNVELSKEQFLLMPSEVISTLLVENCVNNLSNSDIIEITIGVVGFEGEIVAMLPSETPSSLGILTVEEKFNKGVGVNLTPPPKLNTVEVKSIRERVGILANRLKIKGYARIDFFYNKKNDQLILIEVNSLPGLTPATILYTQALLTPEISLKPSEFLSHLVEIGLES